MVLGHRLQNREKINHVMTVCKDPHEKKIEVRNVQLTSCSYFCSSACNISIRANTAMHNLPKQTQEGNGKTGAGNTLLSVREERTGVGVDILSSIPVGSFTAVAVVFMLWGSVF